MSEGFGKVDRIAREMAAAPRPPPGRPSRRSAPLRWATLGLLGAAGAAGALYFVVGGDASKKPTPPGGATEQGGTTLGGASPMGPAPSLELSSGDARGARAAQIAAVLDDIDATLHAMRLSWPGKMGQLVWRAPGWLDAARLERDLAALDSQLAGAEDPVSSATRAWIAVARPDGARLLALHAAWNAPGASADAIAGELRPLFDRLVVASQSVHAAVAVDLQKPEPGTMAALAWACRVSPLLARLPVRGFAAAPPMVEQDGTAPAPAPVLTEPSASELRSMAEGCYDAGRAFLAANSADDLDHNDLYQLSLATQISLNLLHEIDRRRGPASGRAYVTTAGNLAQESSYLATARRQRDPTLRPAEAPPPAPR